MSVKLVRLEKMLCTRIPNFTFVVTQIVLFACTLMSVTFVMYLSGSDTVAPEPSQKCSEPDNRQCKVGLFAF